MSLLTKIRSFFWLVLFIPLYACTTIDTKPFEKFNESLVELDKGATSSLDIAIPLAEARYKKELEDDIAQGSDTLLKELSIQIKEDDPFFISKPPVFLEAKKFKLGISKTNLVWLEYSNLLLKLSSKEFLKDDKFSKLSSELNENAFDAVQALKDNPSDTTAKDTALFSELAIAAAKEYLKSKQKEKLTEAITNNQANIEKYVEHMQSAIVTMAQSSTQEHSEKQQELGTSLVRYSIDNENGKNSAKIKKAIADMIEVKTIHSEQMVTLEALHAAYGNIPDAHEALANRLRNSDSSIAAITDLLEKGIQLHTSIEVKAKANKAELVQAKADATDSKATAAEVRYQQAKLKASEAQFEYTLAQNALAEDPDNETKKKAAEDKKAIADKLKIEADTLKNSAESLRASATAIQESANEVKNSLINN